uniref:Uncharacterized protein n=1 Tax=Mycena chlorophos TaxID=658473 RepID=A0ABQ0LFS6_MYCCL|nr:predicted protein [Mycena chlorophos]
MEPKILSWHFTTVVDGRFDTALALKQRRSNEIMVFSAVLQALVMVIWPGIENDNPAPASELCNLLREYGRYWPCFCAVLDVAAPSCRIVNFIDRSCFALCHYDPPHCQFFLPLNHIEKSRNYLARAPQLKISNDVLRKMHLVHGLLSGPEGNFACPNYTGDRGHQLGGFVSPLSSLVDILKEFMAPAVISHSTIAIPRTPIPRGPTLLTRNVGGCLGAIIWRIASGEGVREQVFKHAFVRCVACDLVFLKRVVSVAGHDCGTQHPPMEFPAQRDEHLGSGVVRAIPHHIRSLLGHLLSGHGINEMAFQEVVAKCSQCGRIYIPRYNQIHVCSA